MKDWEDIIKERQLSRKAELPESDWNDFLSRKAEHERAAKKRRRILAVAFSIPAAAAVLLLLFLIPFNTVVPDNQVSQNEPSEQQAVTDSIDVNPVDSVMVPANPEPDKTVIIKSKPVKKTYAQNKQPESQPEIVETLTGSQDKQLLAQVAVSAVVAQVHMVNDTAMFNTAEYKLPEGSSAEDLIRKLPGVEIDNYGSITVNGKAVQRILVNGKEFFSDEKTVELTQLTADMIEKVKAYEKNSDLARQTGIDDGKEEQVLTLNWKTEISHMDDSVFIPDTLFNKKGVVRVPVRNSRLKKYKDCLLKIPGVQVTDDGIVTVDGKTVKKIIFKGKERIEIICSKEYSVVYLPYTTQDKNKCRR